MRHSRETAFLSSNISDILQGFRNENSVIDLFAIQEHLKLDGFRRNIDRIIFSRYLSIRILLALDSDRSNKLHFWQFGRQNAWAIRRVSPKLIGLKLAGSAGPEYTPPFAWDWSFDGDFDGYIFTRPRVGPAFWLWAFRVENKHRLWCRDLPLRHGSVAPSLQDRWVWASCIEEGSVI